MSSPTRTRNIDGLGRVRVSFAAGTAVKTHNVENPDVEPLPASPLQNRRLVVLALPLDQLVFGGEDLTPTSGYASRGSSRGSFANDQKSLRDAYSSRFQFMLSQYLTLLLSSDAEVYGDLAGEAFENVVVLELARVIIRNRSGTQAADGTENEDKVELTAGLASRRWLIIKCMGDDVNGQKFLYVGGDDIFVGQDPHHSKGMPAWARYELILSVQDSPPVYALKSGGQAALEVRIMEIG